MNTATQTEDQQIQRPWLRGLAPPSFRHRVRLVAPGAVSLGSLSGCTKVAQRAVVHGRHLEADREDDQWGDDAKRARPVRIEISAELAVESVPVPILEFRMDL